MKFSVDASTPDLTTPICQQVFKLTESFRRFGNNRPRWFLAQFSQQCLTEVHRSAAPIDIGSNRRDAQLTQS